MTADIDQVRTALETTLKSIFEAVADVYMDRDTLMQGLQVLRLHGFAESPIINAPPGAGKTTMVTRLANELFEEHGLPILYLIPNHNSVSNVEGREHWNHWKGHSRLCGEKGRSDDLLRDKGYWVDSSHDGL